MEPIVPTVSYNLFSGRVEVKLFGQPIDWGIKDEPKEVLEGISHIVANTGVLEILAPMPSSFNARICSGFDLKQRFNLGSRRYLKRGYDADGVFLHPGQAFWLSSADCLTLIAYEQQEGGVIAAHAGRDSLFDRQRISGQTSNRSHESIVDAITDWMRNYLHSTSVFMTCGIGAENFAHPINDPTSGSANSALCLDALLRYGPTCFAGNPKEGKLSLREVARAQFIRNGVSADRIGSDNIDTFNNRDINGNFLWWSHRRGDGERRNGVLVIRRW